ncbi:hypothetical protein ISN44_As08g038230 [Arabidopsis suecica]|uniref:Replication protein A 70 kDa DNA-binding subunit B/D first OB fold domain-containing protein n=1 Tax=Arabidopsis suecica TaxID=45249 RepID=A0A8T2BC33_ARASU|nr:hypothetical protein ISN44_As08g038230 [Arabidopsis suecica]
MRYKMFDDVSRLNSSKDDWVIQVKVLCLWQQNLRGLGTSLEVILSDSKGSKVQASFRGCAYHRSGAKITFGDWFDLNDFKVLEQYGSCKATDHRYKIIVLYSTEIVIADVMGDENYINFVDFSKITDGVHCDDCLVDVIRQVVHVGEFPTWDGLNVCRKGNDSDKDDYNSDDIDELDGDGECGKESCAEDVVHVEDDPAYQIDDDDKVEDIDNDDECIVSIEANGLEPGEDEYDLVEDCDECDCCDESDYEDEEHEDLCEVEDDEYEDGDEDDEDDGDEGYSEMTESKEESLDDCDCETVEKQCPDKVDEYSMYHKISLTFVTPDSELLDDNDSDNDEDLVGGEESGKESGKDESACVEDDSAYEVDEDEGRKQRRM